MKKILLSILLFAATGLTVKTFSQVGGCANGTGACDLIISGVEVTVGPYQCNTPSAGKITVTFDLKFKLKANSGNKWIFIHSYLQGDYPTVQPPTSVSGFFPCSGSATDPPTRTNGGKLPATIGQAGTSFLNLGIDNTGTNPTLIGAGGYTPDAGVALNSATSITKTNLPALGVDSFSIKGVTVVINASCIAGMLPSLVVKTDVWSSQGQQASKAQCWVGGITTGFNDPTINLQKQCNTPRTFTLNVSTSNTVPSTLTYSLFIDADNSGDVNAGDIDITSVLGDGTFENFDNTHPLFTPAPTSYPPYSNTPGIASKPLIFRGSTPLTANVVAAKASDPVGCIPLPVKFNSFTAARNHSNVVLKWETAFEQNSKGFAVERNIRGVWEQVSFVASQAADGNSNSALAYLFVDLNDVKGITQYRLRQVDLDAKSSFSEIRAVRGEGQTGKTVVFPNPSLDGRVSVVFEDATVTRDVSLSDMAGRILKQWKGVTNNNIQIDNLIPGMYSLKIVVPATGIQSVEKIIVSKR